MKIDIDEIIVEKAARIRKENNDIESLQNSIAEVGLINPVLIDENNRLLAGYRRLTACRNLGWTEIEATVAEVGEDPLRTLELEVAENLHRKDFTPEEVLAAEQRRQEIIESLRKKSLFERFWLWLKKMFGGGSSGTGGKPEEVVVEEPAPLEKTEEAAKAAEKKVPKTGAGQNKKDTITIFKTSGRHSP